MPNDTFAAKFNERASQRKFTMVVWARFNSRSVPVFCESDNDVFSQIGDVAKNAAAVVLKI